MIYYAFFFGIFFVSHNKIVYKKQAHKRILYSMLYYLQYIVIVAIYDYTRNRIIFNGYDKIFAKSLLVCASLCCSDEIFLGKRCY